jgi:hypothetical protein
MSNNTVPADGREICPGDPEHYKDAHGPGQVWWGVPFSHEGKDGGKDYSEWVISKHDAAPSALVEDVLPDWLKVDPRAWVYYNRELDVVQAAKEKCTEWSFDQDSHGYCHDRVVLQGLLRKIETVNGLLADLPDSVPPPVWTDGYRELADAIPSVHDLAHQLLRAAMRGDKGETARIVRTLDRETRDHFRASFDRVIEAIDHEDM